ncbi:MAG: DUF1553 domain-containing protein, partial [Verrucomicrobiales bacterium]
ISEEILAIERRLDIGEPIASPSGGERLRPPVDPVRNIERIQPTAGRFVRFTILGTIDNNRHEPCIDELEIYDQEGRNLARDGSPSSSGDRGGDPQHQLAHINDGQYGNGRSWISDQLGGGWVQIELPAVSEIERIVWGRDREGQFGDRLAQRYRIEVALVPGEWEPVASSGDRVALGDPHDADVALLERFPGQPEVARLVALRKQLAAMPPVPKVFAGAFRDPEPTFLLNRGNPEQRGERLQPAVPVTLGELTLPEQTPDQARRVALASWIASAENPLTPRVIANRIWQYHFGRGLVDTTSDFGFNGSAPSHPELLDSLARELVRSGWSIKHLHRLILLSATYRQSNRIDPAAQALDRECRLLWRFPSRRLEAEAIRDSILSVSGQLDLKMGGPGFDFFKSRGGLNGFPVVESFAGEGLRRMIYAHKVRMERAPVFGAFDCPDAGQATPRRSRSTTAIQALNLFNGRFVIDQAGAFAARIGGGGVAHAFQIAYGRDPSPSELAACEQTVRHHGMATLCRVIFNSNEFLFLP